MDHLFKPMLIGDKMSIETSFFVRSKDWIFLNCMFGFKIAQNGFAWSQCDCDQLDCATLTGLIIVHDGHKMNSKIDSWGMPKYVLGIIVMYVGYSNKSNYLSQQNENNWWPISFHGPTSLWVRQEVISDEVNPYLFLSFKKGNVFMANNWHKIDMIYTRNSCEESDSITALLLWLTTLFMSTALTIKVHW